MKIALVLLPMWSVEAAPLGIASISAALAKEGHEVRSFDLNVGLHKKLGEEYWDLSRSSGWGNRAEFQSKILPLISETVSSLAKRIVADGYDAVGFTMYKTNSLTIGWMATLLRFLSPRIKIVVGGPEVAFTDWHRLINYQFDGVVDAAVVGEGESSAIAMFKAWETGTSIAGIPGVITVADQKVEFSGRPAPLDVNTIVPPDFSDFDLKAYNRKVLPVQFSRGCVANCSFCNEKAFLWPSFQMKSAAGVLDHLQHLADKFGMRDFWAADSLLNGNHTKLADFVDLVIAGNYGFSWAGNMRIDKRLRPPLAERLKIAGCHQITFGVESGSNAVLKAMRKGITRDDTIQVLTQMRQTGIKSDVNLIVGFPGEAESDFQDTLRLLDEVGEGIGWVSTTIFTLDPHTDVGRNPKKYGIRTSDDGQVVRDETSPYFGNDWFSESGDSTPEIRLNRLYRLREYLKTRVPQAYVMKISNG
jgi:radical SAM superfamily enzyme YgiQ (UPF0313 family)